MSKLEREIASKLERVNERVRELVYFFYGCKSIPAFPQSNSLTCIGTTIPLQLEALVEPSRSQMYRIMYLRDFPLGSVALSLSSVTLLKCPPPVLSALKLGSPKLCCQDTRLYPQWLSQTSEVKGVPRDSPQLTVF